MELQIPANAGKWWRFSKYEVRGGYILPSDGARLTRTDPWQNYGAKRVGRHAGQAPYQSLISIVQRFPPLGPDGELPRKSADELAEWCSTYGLLGVLPHRVELVYLAPGSDGSQRGYLRGGTGWREVSVLKPEETVEVELPRRLPGGDEFGADRDIQVAATGLLQASAAAFVQPLDGGPPVRENLETTWAQYFRAPPHEQSEGLEFPMPLSDAFWDRYQEPVADFVASAHALISALSLVNEEPEAMTAAFEYLLVTVRPVILKVKPNRGPEAPQQMWRSHSLLGSLAMMAVRDLLGTGRVRKCPSCQSTFMSFATNDQKAKWCSKRCRTREAVRAFRKLEQKPSATGRSTR
jgi:hypothetical protein